MPRKKTEAQPLPYIYDVHWDCKTTQDVKRDLKNMALTIRHTTASYGGLIDQLLEDGIKIPGVDLNKLNRLRVGKAYKPEILDPRGNINGEKHFSSPESARAELLRMSAAQLPPELRPASLEGIPAEQYSFAEGIETWTIGHWELYITHIEVLP